MSLSRRLRPISLLILLFLCMPLPIFALPSHQQGGEATKSLTAEIDTLLQDSALRGSIQGVIVESLVDGRVWYERNGDVLFMPASNQKLFTSAAVLHALGPDWKYQTVLYCSGDLDDDGTLHGNLYLRGSGDPLLSARDLVEMAAQIKGAGIRRVAGKLLGDDSRFDHERYGLGWEWDDFSAYYAAPVSGLNLDENLLVVTVSPGKKPGDTVRASAAPTSDYAHLTIRAKTVEKGGTSALRIGRTLGTNEITIDGTLALDAKSADHPPVRVTIDNPTRFATTFFLNCLKREGIGVSGEDGEGILPTSGTREIARHDSAPLSELLKALNKPSDNLMAECFLKTLGAEKGTGGTTAAGKAVAMDWFRSLGIEPFGLQIADGSGLSRHNLVSPRSVARLLRAMTSDLHIRVWIDSLPIAGVDGTLRNRLKGTPAMGNVRAKTGSLSGASSLSGYVTTQDGEKLLFVALVNNFTGSADPPHRLQDRIATLLASWKNKP